MSFVFLKSYSQYIEKLVPNFDGTMTVFVKIKNQSRNFTIPWDSETKDFDSAIVKIRDRMDIMPK